MIVAFANNQEMQAPAGTTTQIVTDPVPLGDHDFALAIANIHYFIGAPQAALQGKLETSDDGTAWVEAIGLNSIFLDPSLSIDGPVNARFLRGVFTLVPDAGAPAAVAFDLHVRLGRVSPKRACSGCEGESPCPSCAAEAAPAMDGAERISAVPADGGGFVGGTLVTSGATPPVANGQAVAPPSPLVPTRPGSDRPLGEVPADTRRPGAEIPRFVAISGAEASYLAGVALPDQRYAEEFRAGQGPPETLYLPAGNLQQMYQIGEWFRGPGFMKAPGAGALDLGRLDVSSPGMPSAGPAAAGPGTGTGPSTPAWLPKVPTNPPPPTNPPRPGNPTNPTNPTDPTVFLHG